MTYYEFINYVESKVTFPFSLSLKARKQFRFYYHKYSVELIKECIEVGVKHYLRYDADGLATQKSVQEFLNKLGGILHNKTRSPIQQSINYIQAIGRKKHECWDKETAQRMLVGYIDALTLYRCWNTEKINKELREDVVRITREARDWNEWKDKIYEKHLDAAKDDWRKGKKPPEAADEY